MNKVASKCLKDAINWDLVIKYLPLLNRIIGQHSYKYLWCMNNKEIYSAGLMGLIDAARRFCPDKHIYFGVYAATRIKGAIADEFRIHSLSNEYYSFLKRNHKNKIRNAFLSVEYGRNGYGLNEELEDESPKHPRMILEEKEEIELLKQCIDELTPRNKEVLSLYYLQEMKLKDIAEHMDLSFSRISQICSQALSTLKTRFLKTQC